FDVNTSQTFKVGDLVRVSKVPANLHDAAGIATPRIFEEALGRQFRVMGFNSIGFVELQVSKTDTIWIEPEFLVLERASAATK
ncbi:MAG: hypothetical protein ACKO50_09030, partial [Cyanobium sp.]